MADQRIRTSAMNSLPSVFISHGAPTLPINPSMPSHAFLHRSPMNCRACAPSSCSPRIGRRRIRSRASRKSPRRFTIFTAFHARCTNCGYPAPGAPELASDAAALLDRHGIPAATAEHGLDHGAWVPLLLMFPDADIPVAQLSIQPRENAAHHFRVGRALRELRERRCEVEMRPALHHISRTHRADIRRLQQHVR